MTERSRFWGGTTTGDATVAPYDAETEFAQVLRSIASAGIIPTDLSGVFLDNTNELNGSLGGGSVSPITINTGRALVDGTWYENDASVNVTIPTPGASTRIDRIVLRKSFSAQTVRITRIAGTEGAGIPALTQTAGVTWDMPLWQASITTGGIITLTDDRKFLDDPGASVFGDGSDGDVTISGITTLTRSMYYNNLIITATGTLRTNGYRVFVKGTLNILTGGVLEVWNSSTQANSASGSTPGLGVGIAGWGDTSISLSAPTGAVGGTGVGANGVQPSAPSGGAHAPAAVSGGAGGAGGAGTPNAGGSAITSATTVANPLKHLTTNSYISIALATGYGQLPVAGCSGSSGSAGGGDGANSGGGGGAGGVAGGFMWVYARTIINAGTIRANGQQGGNGGNSVAGNTGGGGGGGGGSGGFIYLVYISLVAGTIQVNGGAGSSGGTKQGTGVNGSVGGSGGVGLVMKYNVSTKAWE